MRGEACYLCGKSLRNVALVIKEIVLDGRPRKVHAQCLVRYNKTQEMS